MWLSKMDASIMLQSPHYVSYNLNIKLKEQFSLILKYLEFFGQF